MELELDGGAISADGCYECPDAAFTALRLEIWHRLPWAVDAFVGELSLPLVHLMDLQDRSGWHRLGDPQGKTAAKGVDEVARGEVFLEVQYVTQ